MYVLWWVKHSSQQKTSIPIIIVVFSFTFDSKKNNLLEHKFKNKFSFLEIHIYFSFQILFGFLDQFDQISSFNLQSLSIQISSKFENVLILCIATMVNKIQLIKYVFFLICDNILNCCRG